MMVGVAQPTAVEEKLSLAVQRLGSVPVVMFPWQTVMVGAMFRLVTVGLAVPATPGSSVSTLEKLEPVTVPWLLTEQTPSGNGLSMVTRKTMVIVLSSGKVKPGTPPTVTVSPDKTVRAAISGVVPEVGATTS